MCGKTSPPVLDLDIDFIYANLSMPRITEINLRLQLGRGTVNVEGEHEAAESRLFCVAEEGG
jgi:hypothetical protein